MYAFLLSDVFSTLIVGVILSYLLSTYMGGFIPDNTIIGTMISMMNASISYTAISYLIRRLRSANSKLQDLNSELKQLSIIDGLTGIYNRRFFDLELARECRNATHSAKPLSLIMLDIDFFKAYNDSYGHQEGDKCLTLIAATLNKTIRKPGDIVFRYGGEEFAVILSETDAEGAKIVAENLRCEVENLKIPHIGSKVSNIVTVSVGVSTIVPNPYLIPDKLVSFSDKALYQAKKDGRNTIKYYIE
jgi:diguanylate cyclase (GGDEF)-like protein